MAEIEPKALELRTRARVRDFAALLVDDRAARRRTPAETAVPRARVGGV